MREFDIVSHNFYLKSSYDQVLNMKLKNDLTRIDAKIIPSVFGKCE